MRVGFAMHPDAGQQKQTEASERELNILIGKTIIRHHNTTKTSHTLATAPAQLHTRTHNSEHMCFVCEHARVRVECPARSSDGRVRLETGPESANVNYALAIPGLSLSPSLSLLLCLPHTHINYTFKLCEPSTINGSFSFSLA